MTVATIAQAAAATIDPDDPSTFPISVDDVIRNVREMWSLRPAREAE